MNTKVYLHVRNVGQLEWQQSPREFLRLPTVGEYVTLDEETDTWYRVGMVVHCPFDEHYAAEVYAVKAGNTTDAM